MTIRTLLTLVLGWSAVAVAAEPSEALLLDEATAEQLAALDGIDNDAAAAIVDLREKRGHLGSVEELRILKIDPTGLDSLRKNTAVEVEFPTSSETKEYGSADEVLAEFDSEPTIQDVQAWSNDYADMNPEQVDKWLRASKKFAALPELTLEYELKDGWDQDFFYVNADGIALTNPDDEPLPVLEDAGRDQDSKYKVRAKWNLNELVMSSERIRVINEAQDVVKLRDKLLTEVTRIYFERRRIQVEMLLKPKSDTMGQVKDQLRLLEMTANIDALTGGAFSAALNR